MHNEATDEQQLSATMKRAASFNKLDTVKQQRRQPASVASTVTTDTVPAPSSASGAQPPILATAASLLQPTFAAVALDNADILGLVASFLCINPCRSTEGIDDSLLDFALCSRRTHSLIMRDGPWWRNQGEYDVKMRQPLVALDKWTLLSPDNDALALMVDGFGARQQAIVRRLVGDAVYEREVAPRLVEMRAVTCSRERGMAAVGLTEGHKYVVAVGPPADDVEVQVYPLLTPAFFGSLAHHLPEPCRKHILTDPTHRELKAEPGKAYNEPYCQWLLGSWDAVLLPRCTQWTAHALVNIDMMEGLPQSYQTACLIHTLTRMPGVIQLSVDWEGEWAPSDLQYHPSPSSLAQLTDVLPRLASLLTYCPGSLRYTSLA